MDPQCLGFALRADDLHLRSSLCLNSPALLRGLGNGAVDILLPDTQVLLGILLAHTAIIGVVIRCYDAADEKLRHIETIIRKVDVDLFPERSGQRHELRIDLQDIYAIFLDCLRKVTLDLRHHKRTERPLAQPFAEQLSL